MRIKIPRVWSACLGLSLLFALFANADRPLSTHQLLASRFELLTTLSVSSLPGFQERLVPYLVERGVKDIALMEDLVRDDLLHIAQSLSLFFDHDPKQVLTDFLGAYSHLLDGCTSQIDHVGKELFGPLSFYLPILKEISPSLGLIYLSDRVFPSVSVVKILQKNDPHLKGITIARVYFQSRDADRKKAFLELFQASPVDEKEPQKIEATQDRLSLRIDPIDHLAIRLNTVEEVSVMHERIQKMVSENFLVDLDEVSYNPGDQSSHTKARFRDSSETVFNKIVEFIHYQNN